jgi:hypothetical protein
MVRVARQYNLPLNLHTLRMIRATLLYDTLVLRLDGRLDRYDEYAKFRRDRARWARRRWQKRVRDSRRSLVVRLDEMLRTGDDLLDRAQHSLSSPVTGFTALIDKSVFAFSVISRMLARLVVLTVVATSLVAAASYLQTGVVPVTGTLATVARSSVYQLLVAVIAALNLRHILFRLRDRDVAR